MATVKVQEKFILDKTSNIPTNGAGSSPRVQLKNIFDYVTDPRSGGNNDGPVQWWLDKPQPFVFPNKPKSELKPESTKAPSQILLKCTQAAIDDIIVKYKRKHKYSEKVKEDDQYITIKIKLPLDFGATKKGENLWQVIRFEATKKVMTSNGQQVSEAKMTRMQELGSAFIFMQSLKRNVKYPTWQHIRSHHATMRGLNGIWKHVGNVDEVGVDWIQTFWKQNARLLLEVSDPKFTVFNRDGGFMDFISKIVKDNFRISKKDNWNPADIWLIKNEAKHKSFIEDAMKKPSSGSVTKGRWVISRKLELLNSIMRDLFNREEIWGLSLKKISKSDPIANWEKVNVSDDFFNDMNIKYMQYDSSQIFMGKKTLKDGTISLASQDTRLIVKDGGSTYDFQIKANSSSSYSNLKYEPTDKGATAARLGKATAAYVEALLEEHDLKGFDKTAENYPKTAEVFESQEDKWIGKLKYLADKGVDFGLTGTKEAQVNQAYDNLFFVFGTTPWVANSKLQQMQWLSEVLSLKGKATSGGRDSLNEFCTDLVFLAKKEGPRYGPFGKLY